LLDELFAEVGLYIKLQSSIAFQFDVDSDGFIDYEEFAFLVKNYLLDEDGKPRDN
jgi:hypothetical protein